MLLTIKKNEFESLPAGAYKAVFQSFTTIDTAKGKAYRWAFTVLEGTSAGKTISDLSDAGKPPSPKNKTGGWLSALSGKPLADGTAVDPDEYIGKSYLVMLEARDDGKTKIATVKWLPTGLF